MTKEGETGMPSRVRTTATNRGPMDSMRRTALVAGVLYLITIGRIRRRRQLSWNACG